MNKNISLASRYLLIVLAGLGNLTFFYKIFYPLTFYLSSFTLSLFGQVNNFYTLNLILFNETAIDVINACVAGSAYYLLLILVLSVPNLRFLKRAYVLLFSFASLLIINVLRIVFMGLIARSSYFESVHMLFWYFISLLIVVGIWFLSVKIFSIKDTPIYSDIQYLLEQTKKSKRNSKNNKSSN